MHVLQQPTYASKYPPAQGLVLALGQVLCDQPIVGVWLSGALASAAICWMLLGCLRPRWAALGGVLAAPGGHASAHDLLESDVLGGCCRSLRRRTRVRFCHQNPNVPEVMGCHAAGRGPGYSRQQPAV
jgi:hypothetical protein